MRLQNRLLKINMKGDDVALCQQELQQLGYEIDPSEIREQRFGKFTRRAVLKFQKKQDLQPTGVVDETTADRINDELSGEQCVVSEKAGYE